MRIRLFLVVVFIGLGAVFVGPLGAHTEVFERAPEMGQVVGGTVDHVDISFWTAVGRPQMAIVDPDGRAVAIGPVTLEPGGRIVSVEFPPLTVEGQYVVTHSESDPVDGDLQTTEFSFTFDADSNNEVGSLIVRNDGPNWVLLGIIVGVVLILVGFFWPGRSSTPSKKS
ncbi:MAG: methionine-rich copper-binding protein CopC [Verrucomicrobiales bacterium]|jgi:methionine-rich copper-binding protein CopC